MYPSMSPPDGFLLIVDDQWQKIGKKRSFKPLTSSPVNQYNAMPLRNRFSPIAGGDEASSDDSFDLPVGRVRKRRKRNHHRPTNAAMIDTSEIIAGTTSLCIQDKKQCPLL